MPANLPEPRTFVELAAWLTIVSEKSGSHSLLPKEEREPCRNVESVWLWLQGYEHDNLQAIEAAADKLWLHEEEAFQDLPLQVAKALRLRIETASELISEFASIEEPPFAYPDVSFRELLHWLLIDWWRKRGMNRASQSLFLRSLA